MMREICTAIKDGKCLELSYDGYTRLVEAHAYGMTKENNDVIRVWQVSGGGGSGSNERTGWKLLRLDEARSIIMVDVKSHGPRLGYKRDDKAMQTIYCQI